ncbi:MAG: hypothetical protein ACT4R6_07750, partial [Gemmatimonadaceae bacterium]
AATEEHYEFVPPPEIAPKQRVDANGGVGAAAAARQAAYGDRGDTPRFPPPPRRVGRAYGGAALAGAVITEIASPIVETVLKLIVDSASDDITFSVPKLEGLKHVNDDKANRGSAMQTATVDLQMPRQGVGGWPFDREIYLDFRVTWQHDGRSLGNIFIQRSKAVDAAGWGLDVKCELLNDAATYNKSDGSGPTFAAIRLLFTSTFDAPWPWDDTIALSHVTLYGNGTKTIRHEWTQ